jgi:hypothetical protein
MSNFEKWSPDELATLLSRRASPAGGPIRDLSEVLGVAEKVGPAQ